MNIMREILRAMEENTARMYKVFVKNLDVNEVVREIVIKDTMEEHCPEVKVYSVFQIESIHWM